MRSNLAGLQRLSTSKAAAGSRHGLQDTGALLGAGRCRWEGPRLKRAALKLGKTLAPSAHIGTSQVCTACGAGLPWLLRESLSSGPRSWGRGTTRALERTAALVRQTFAAYQPRFGLRAVASARLEQASISAVAFVRPRIASPLWRRAAEAISLRCASQGGPSRVVESRHAPLARRCISYIVRNVRHDVG